MLGGGGASQLTTGLVIKSVTTSPTLAGERMLFILQVSILSEQTRFYFLFQFSSNLGPHIGKAQKVCTEFKMLDSAHNDLCRGCQE